MGVEDIRRTIELIRRARSGRTVVLVEHNMGVVAELADQVIVLQQGASSHRAATRPFARTRPSSPRTSGRRMPSPVLEVEGLSARYGEAQALRDVSLHVGQGELVTLVGRNGAGKTTLLRCVMGSTGKATGRFA